MKYSAGREKRGQGGLKGEQGVRDEIKSREDKEPGRDAGGGDPQALGPLTASKAGFEDDLCCGGEGSSPHRPHLKSPPLPSSSNLTHQHHPPVSSESTH